MGRFQVRQREQIGSGEAEFVVEDTQDRNRPVAEFRDRESAQTHAEKLDAGPLDWDEQEAWQDDWDDDEA